MIEHLREVGEARSATEIEDHFQRNFGIEGVTGACEYLADQGLHRQGAAARPADEEEQRRCGRAGVLLRRRKAPDVW